MFSHFAHQAGRSHGEERVCAKDEIAREKIKETVLLSGLWQCRSTRLYFLIRERGRVWLYFTWLGVFQLRDGLETSAQCMLWSMPGSVTHLQLCVQVCTAPNLRSLFPNMSDMW